MHVVQALLEPQALLGGAAALINILGLRHGRHHRQRAEYALEERPHLGLGPLRLLFVPPVRPSQLLIGSRNVANFSVKKVWTSISIRVEFKLTLRDGHFVFSFS